MSDPKTESTPMEVVRVRWLCGDECPGEMKFTGSAFTAIRTSYVHRCTVCGKAESADVSYPSIQYHPKPQEQAR